MMNIFIQLVFKIFAINYIKIIANSSNTRTPSKMPLWLKDDCFCPDVFAVKYCDNIFLDHALVQVLFGRSSLELKEFCTLKTLESTMASS